MRLALRGLRRIRRLWSRFSLLIESRFWRKPRLAIGAGSVRMRGWIATDVDQLDILLDRDWSRYFRPGSIDAILAEHVWEHLSADEGARAAGLCLRYLRPGGRLRVAVPDGLHPDPDYVAAVRPGGSGPGAKDHKVLYNVRTLTGLLEAAGFHTHALEYFDEHGVFHAVDWSPEDGKVRRSARFDERNVGGRLRYTSIVIDALKPVEAGQNVASSPA